ncbi:MAG: hypothetical protein M1378_11630, partial [Bacteroidetes bacterium]|nr:hypothetical protein [Bacteroidota bacterium]
IDIFSARRRLSSKIESYKRVMSRVLHIQLQGDTASVSDYLIELARAKFKTRQLSLRLLTEGLRVLDFSTTAGGKM